MRGRIIAKLRRIYNGKKELFVELDSAMHAGTIAKQNLKHRSAELRRTVRKSDSER